MSRGLKFSRMVVGAGLTPRWDGSSDPLITSVVEDSRQAAPGSCFVATRGLRADGHAFVDPAVRAGASAVVSERPIAVPSSVASVCVPSAKGWAGRLAAVLYGLDQRQRDGRLRVVGVTGTNGKSTFCYLLGAVLKRAGHPTALLGTIQYDLLSRKIDAAMTTPPAVTLMSYLAEAVDAGATHAVMEVSSHALDQCRCDGIRFAVGVFSNLTGDHMDYHGDRSSYLRAKKRLFDGLDRDAVAVINQGDEHGEAMIIDCAARVMRYGLVGGFRRSASVSLDRRPVENEPFSRDPKGSASAQPAVASELAGDPDICARGLGMSATGTRFELAARWGGRLASCELTSPLVGRHNVENCLAAAAAALALGVPLETIAAALASVPCIPGRLERVTLPGGASEGADPGFTVFVDYAHTDDALENVLSAVRPLTRGRLIVLFGCGGDRDRSKRPRMARVAAALADRVVVTSDNPRSEDPQRIIDEITAGFEAEDRNNVHVQPDRKRAITDALAMAGPGDLVVLAGKGHEKYQLISDERIPFDDAAVAADALCELSRRK